MKFKKTLSILLRSIAAILLMIIMKDRLKFIIDNLDFNYFFETGIKSIYILINNEKILDFIQVLFVISIFLIAFYSSLIFSLELIQGYNDIIKYRSKSKKSYIINLIKVFSINFLNDFIVWIISLLFIIFTFSYKDIYNFIITITIFLIVNYLVFMIITLYSKIQAITFVCYIFSFLIQTYLFKNLIITFTILLFALIIKFINMPKFLEERFND